ncbi:peptidoglycan-binding protein [Allorhizocola rhizosphaerae]|uniref:peptidoglycan-binding protein n=1 Tax=Allorhizocola rhizosphaerae TaxID=1872709 RepID=UPI000E3D4E56|nr:peptidoglycan-binding protein [Allorhizocola rhizosphaerae]
MRRWIVPLALAVLVAGAAGFVVANRPTAGAASWEKQLPPNTAKVTRQDLRATEEVTGDLGHGPASSLINRIPGTVTSLPVAGSVIQQGQVLYEVDSHPVVLLYGAEPAYRPLGTGTEGADVRQLETALRALGYTGFSVDEEFTSGTADAVREWQEDLGLPETGRVELGRVVFVSEAIRVETLRLELGQPAQAGQALLTHTGITRLVTARLDVADQRMAVPGTHVKIEMPSGASVSGKVEKVYSVIEAPSGQGQQSQTRLEAIISLADPKAAEGFDAAAVDIEFTVNERRGVLAVPVAALVALAEGGYGVEVVDGAASRYVRVETGLFAGGHVEVSGPDVAEGMTVGMPK